MYNLVLLRMDLIVILDSYIILKEADNFDFSYGLLRFEGFLVFCQFEEFFSYNIYLYDEILSEYFIKYGVWQIVLGLIQNYFDLKDFIIGQKFFYDIVLLNGSFFFDGDFSELTYKEIVLIIEND